jgi:uncharacterized membrane protein
MLGAVLYGSGCVWFIRSAGPEPAYLRHFLPGQLLTGSGVGLIMTNLSTAVSLTLAPSVLAVGSATLAAARQFGTVLGVAVLLAVMGTTRSADPVAPFRHGWTMMAIVAGVAFVTAAFIGRARHVDVPSTVDGRPVVVPSSS